MSNTSSRTLFKVLVNGASCHGGAMQWSLPRETSPGHYEPGDWHEVDGDLSLCERGIHLTSEPYNWYRWNCTAYEAEARDPGAEQTNPHKIVCRAARLLRPIPHPQWWNDAVAFVESLKDLPWLKPDGQPDPTWKLFTAPSRAAAWDAARPAARDAAWGAARAAAWDAARDAAGDAARDAARDAAGDAAIMARCLVVSDLIAPEHLAHARARMGVWRKGYSLLCDINGVLYVYAGGSTKWQS